MKQGKTQEMKQIDAQIAEKSFQKMVGKKHLCLKSIATKVTLSNVRNVEIKEKTVP